MYFVLLQFSIYTLAEKPGDLKESKAHANRVFELASKWFKELGEKNTFKPVVLVKITHEPSDKHSIGSSMAVSHYLRPICLHNRIIRLKRTLAKKILHFAPLKLEKKEWVFEAFQHKRRDDGYSSKKDTCKNCKMIFFGDCWGEGHNTFLGACAEYCAVNELLPFEETLKEHADHDDQPFLKRNISRCSILFEGFKDISKKCIDAFSPEKEINEKLLQEVYWEVIYKVHIFGLKPECNSCFKFSSTKLYARGWQVWAGLALSSFNASRGVNTMNQGTSR